MSICMLYYILSDSRSRSAQGFQTFNHVHSTKNAEAIIACSATNSVEQTIVHVVRALFNGSASVVLVHLG